MEYVTTGKATDLQQHLFELYNGAKQINSDIISAGVYLGNINLASSSTVIQNPSLLTEQFPRPETFGINGLSVVSASTAATVIPQQLLVSLTAKLDGFEQMYIRSDLASGAIQINQDSPTHYLTEMTGLATGALNHIAQSGVAKLVIENSEHKYPGWTTGAISLNNSEDYKIGAVGFDTGSTIAHSIGVEKLDRFYLETSLVNNATFLSSAAHTLGGLQINQVGNYIGLQKIQQQEIISSFGTVATGYNDVIQSFAHNPASFFGTDPMLTLNSSKILFTGANLLESISTPFEPSPTKEALKREVYDEGIRKIIKQLTRIREAYANAFEGGLEAIDSKNPDKTRHFMVSFREILNNLFWELAPNEAIENWKRDDPDWKKNPELYFNDKPTRRVRMLYIGRNMKSRQLQEFLITSIRDTLEVYETLSNLHVIELNFNRAQILDIKLKAMASLQFLLDAHFSE